MYIKLIRNNYHKVTYIYIEYKMWIKKTYRYKMGIMLYRQVHLFLLNI